MRDRLLAILSREWLALALGAMFVLLAVALVRTGSGSALAVSALLLAGVILSFGSIIHLLKVRRARAKYPPPGKLVKIAGGRIHVFAEGEADGALPVVWLGGGHSPGLSMVHLHDVLKTKTRSILIDRFGTGWSDTGTFPRRAEQESHEIPAALRAAGEEGPFVLVGYSQGGLLAANIARRYPQLVARLVLLDATPLETILFGPPLGALRAMRRDAFQSGLLRLVGVHIDLILRRARRLLSKDAFAAFEKALGPSLATLRAIDVTAGGQFAVLSSCDDLHGPTIARNGWETSVYDGDLGDLDLWVVAPGTAKEVLAEREVADAGTDQQRMVRFFATSRERYVSASTNSRRIVTPEGTTHQFVYEAPEFVAQLVEDAIRPLFKPEERQDG